MIYMILLQEGRSISVKSQKTIDNCD